MTRVWPFYAGHRVRHKGNLYRVDRYGKVQRRSRRSIRWIACGAPVSRAIRTLILQHSDVLPNWSA